MLTAVPMLSTSPHDQRLSRPASVMLPLHAINRLPDRCHARDTVTTYPLKATFSTSLPTTSSLMAWSSRQLLRICGPTSRTASRAFVSTAEVEIMRCGIMQWLAANSHNLVTSSTSVRDLRIFLGFNISMKAWVKETVSSRCKGHAA